MSYDLERNQAAEILGVSSRTIDRYIQANRIRTMRVGKKILLESEDVDFLKNNEEGEGSSGSHPHVIVENSQNSVHNFSKKPLVIDYRGLFEEAQNALARKEEYIREISYRLGQAETELKHTISLAEYKKATYLLESAQKESQDNEQVLAEKVKKLETTLRQEEGTNQFLMIALLLFLVLTLALWFVNL